jgi:adenylyltransferase/sulfurtransferase
MDDRARERYSRQTRFAPIGEAGQHRLLSAHVAVVGCGALGSFQAGALARAGVGSLTLIDRDFVELSNLQRQWLFEESDVQEGLPKAIAAARAIARIDASIQVRALVADLTPANIDEVLEACSVILDGTDNFETRYLINDYAVARNVAWIYGAAVGSYGLTLPVLPGLGPCLRCIYPQSPPGAQPTCETVGVLNAITSAVASLQVAAALQLVTGYQPAIRLTTLDLWDGVIRQIDHPARDPECPTCALRDFVHLLGTERPPISLCGRNAVQIHERRRPLDLKALEETLSVAGEVRANEFALRLFIPPHEMTIFPDGRAIVKGTQDVALARSLYARYIGA